jgi:hypothetical protein
VDLRPSHEAANIHQRGIKKIKNGFSVKTARASFSEETFLMPGRVLIFQSGTEVAQQLRCIF